MRSPTAGLAHASGRPVPACRSVDVVSLCDRSSVSATASMAALASRMVSVVDVGADARVDQPAERIGQRRVHVA